MENAKELIKKLILSYIKELNISYLKEEITAEEYNEGIRNFTQMYFERVGELLHPDEENTD